MRFLLLLGPFLLFTFATHAGASRPALAHGLNLAWRDCYSGDAHQNANHLCGTPGGIPPLVASLQPGEPLGVVGMEIVIDIAVDGPSLEPWWQYGPGSCREGALWTSLEATGSCATPWSTDANAALSFEQVAPNRMHVRLLVTGSAPFVMDPSVYAEWTLATFTLRPDPSGACAGCTLPACLVLCAARFMRPGSLPDLVLNTPAVASHVTWQGGGRQNCPGFGHQGCPVAVPVTAPSWGRVKQMYR